MKGIRISVADDQLALRGRLREISRQSQPLPDYDNRAARRREAALERHREKSVARKRSQNA